MTIHFDDRETPDWVPGEALRYIEHVSGGRPIRAIARDRGVHASTIMRQVRKTEERREDVLVDMALERLQANAVTAVSGALRKDSSMNAMTQTKPLPDDKTLDAEALRILTRLAEPAACLAIASDMEKAVVVRDSEDGTQVRTAIVDREVAEALALKDWIESRAKGRITRYTITPAGRVALKRLAERSIDAGPRKPEWAGDDGLAFGESEEELSRRRRQRYAPAESPLLMLARRRDKAGKAFLPTGFVAAGERLREDFELARMTSRDAQDWQDYLTASAPSLPPTGDDKDAARGRVARALNDLGPGLGDVVLRCCCYLEGLESVERSLGWSARSGKIVLRIALSRLKRHYDEQGPDLRLIG